MSENEVLELSLPVSAVDNKRLQVLTRNTEGNLTPLGFINSISHSIYIILW